MAVPQSFSMLDISGKFSVNKTLTDANATDTILKAQGVGTLKRQVANHVSPTIQIRHSKDAAGVEHLEIEAPETRTLTWTEQTIESPLFGSIVARTRRATAEGLGDEFLSTGWTPDTLEAGLIETEMKGDEWTLVQMWGTEEVNGERRHTRHLQCTGAKGEVVQVRLVYDFGACCILFFISRQWD
ncbi:hypothetical protein FB451DRAFT_1018960 [Mycena latifolia]|nr:hypothetical protein FB451DRAFT_1018960 [Mycena latifolia]